MIQKRPTTQISELTSPEAGTAPLISSWIDGVAVADTGAVFEKRNPHNGQVIFDVQRSTAKTVDAAIASAKKTQRSWAATTPVRRGQILHQVANLLESRAELHARINSLETGKSLKDALGETHGAVAIARFMAGEGQRLYGRTMTSGMPNKHPMSIREPLGVAGLIIAANTPIANIAWKVFPALICGNAAVLKASEDAPATALAFALTAEEAGLPAGVLQTVQGLGSEAGARLVEHPDVPVLSFTGSTAVGRMIQRVASDRLARVSLELGGKNPLVVCDDADINNAVKWAALSAFSNAGQRCAAGSRVIVFDSIYEMFREKFVAAAKNLRLGIADTDDLGPVVNERQYRNILSAVARAKENGARILCGGTGSADPCHAGGYYISPTIVEGADLDAEISQNELFGPVTCLYRTRSLEHAIEMANHSAYGLTACIHSQSIHRAIRFSREVQAGTVVVNAGTYGSEPHMPFGGVKQSGNGTREPGTEALDVYSNLKNIHLCIDPDVC